MNQQSVTRLLYVIALSVSSTGCASNELLTSNAGYPIDRSFEKLASWQNLNLQNLFEQRFDYSCGAAALATLMKYYFDDDVSEKSLLADVKSILSTEQYAKVEQDGLSFFELEQISQSKGYQAISVNIDVAALSKLKGPILVYVEPDGYRHFAILRGMVENRVFIADPSRGNIRMSTHEFQREWKGQALILGKEGFGLPDKHGLDISFSPEIRRELFVARYNLRNNRNFLVPR